MNYSYPDWEIHEEICLRWLKVRSGLIILYDCIFMVNIERHQVPLVFIFYFRENFTY